MSIVAVKINKNEIQVASDGIAISGDEIVDENFEKVKKISETLIIGGTGLSDSLLIYHKFVEDNLEAFENLEQVTEALQLFKRFKDSLIEDYGYAADTIKNFGGFLVVNKHFYGVFYYDEWLTPYSSKLLGNGNSFAFGSTGIYTSALLDAGIDIVEAIKKSAEKYTSVNSNVTLLTINLE